MIIFLNEERAYANWVKQHRDGYVLDGRHTTRIGHCVLHRADCADIKPSAANKRAHWTTGRKFKACSLDRGELEDWSLQEAGHAPSCCPLCQPEQTRAPESGRSHHLSKLAAEVLDYVLDAALIHMEHEYLPYQLTIDAIAACFNKGPGQIALALRRLATDGLVSIQGGVADAAPIRPNRVVVPTVLAMRTIEAFRDECETAIQCELAKLKIERPEP